MTSHIKPDKPIVQRRMALLLGLCGLKEDLVNPYKPIQTRLDILLFDIYFIF